MTGLRFNLGRRIVPTGAIVTAIIAFAPTFAHAQFVPPPPTPIFPNLTDNAIQLSAGAAQLDIGSSFLQRLGRQATWGYAQRDNGSGGGASESTEAPRYRAWVEGYGNASRTDA